MVSEQAILARFCFSIRFPLALPSQIKAVCTNSLRKLLLPVFCLFLREMGRHFVQTLPKLFAQTVFLFGWVVFWGVSPLHAKDDDHDQDPLLREFLKALETTTAMKRRKISCSCGSDCWASDSSFHGCWLGIVVVWRLLWVQLLPLNDGRVEKSSFHGCYRLGTPGGWIGTLQSRSLVISWAV